MLDLLKRTGELAGAAGPRSLLAGSGLLTHHIRVQRARTFFRKMEFLCGLRPLVDHDVDHLRNHVAGALDDDGVPDPDIAPVAQLLAVATETLDVIFIVQRDGLRDDADDVDRLDIAGRLPGVDA